MQFERSGKHLFQNTTIIIDLQSLTHSVFLKASRNNPKAGVPDFAHRTQHHLHVCTLCQAGIK